MQLLNEAFTGEWIHSRISDDPNAVQDNNREWVIAHGLWQWPGQRARELGNPYLFYPHGMLDPWFKKSYPIKHFKETILLVDTGREPSFVMLKQYVLLQRRNVGWLKVLFSLTGAKDVVTGLGVNDPPPGGDEQSTAYFRQFPKLRDRKILLYLGRFHPKKGVDDLIRAWKKLSIKDSDILVLAGPMEENNPWINHLKKLAEQTLLFIGRVCWRVN